MSPIMDGATALTSSIVPARRFGLRPDTGTDMTSALQNIFTNAPLGCTIETEPGEYILNSLLVFYRQMNLIMRGHWVLQNAILVGADNSEIKLAPGCYIEKDPDGTVIEPFVFSAQVTPSSWDDITVDPAAGDVTITVTTPANFQPGNWIKIKDDAKSWGYPTSDFTHWETNRVRSKLGSVLTLEYPLADAYATVSGTKPSVSTFTPCVGSGLVGPGKISNGSTSDPDAGNAGVRFTHCAGGYVRGVEFEHVKVDCIRYTDSYLGLIHDNYCHDSTDFDGDGRGVACSRSTHVVISNNRLVRLRHGTDVGWWARHILVTGNIARGCAESMYTTHPDVSHYYLIGNEVDGSYGFAAGGAEWGSTSAPAIGIRQNNHHIYIINNKIANTRVEAITSLADQGGHYYIIGNQITNANLVGGSTWTAAINVGQGIAAYHTEGPFVIEGNTINGSRYRGIIAAASDLTIRRNIIKNVTSSGAAIHVMPRINDYDPGASPDPILPDPIDNILIDDNDIDTSGGYGIWVGGVQEATTNVTVSRNRIAGCVLSGIYAEPYQIDELTISENKIRNCNTNDDQYHAAITVGVQAEADVASTNLIITENRIWDCYRRGIMTVVGGAQITRNRVYDLVGTNPLGIYVPAGATGQTATEIIIESNIVRNAYSGIFVTDSSASLGQVTGPIIARNTVTDCTESGIRLRGHATGNNLVNAIVADNICFGNTSYQIRDNESATTTRYVTVLDVVNYRLGLGTTAPDSQLHLTDKIHIGGETEIDGALNHDGTTVGFYGANPVSQSTGWTITNKTEDKVLDCNATSIDEVADVLGTLIDQLKTLGILGT